MKVFLHEPTVVKTMVGAQRVMRGRLGVWVVLGFD
ncbi:hypothetical protein THOM_2190 [Trachipleistophora hominis]|uniref:Uncharacterized protein n=1 Tax=Trachipleistophora hominis TaxID=72359 RepID=L7JTS5_TRAHO|nr:hypothetical protein THOM_2190 [Trachipleistophora hominis]